MSSVYTDDTVCDMRKPDADAMLPDGYSWQLHRGSNVISGGMYDWDDADSVYLCHESGGVMLAWERTRRGNWRSVPC